jgi:hypothetical protein
MERINGEFPPFNSALLVRNRREKYKKINVIVHSRNPFSLPPVACCPGLAKLPCPEFFSEAKFLNVIGTFTYRFYSPPNPHPLEQK